MSRNLLRRFDQFRRRHTEGISTWLYGWIGRDRVLLKERLPTDQVKRVLVLRNNKRIGNMYFLLPFLNSLRDTYPQASIDLMVISDAQAQIFKGMSLTRIWVSHFAFGTAWSFIQTLRQCRKQPYDLLLMPHPSSTDILIGGYIHARNKVSFASPKVNRVYPHAIKAPHASVHAAQTPLALLDGPAQNHPPINHLMVYTEHERDQARDEVRLLRGDATYCIAYFRGARGKKIVPDTDWLAIRQWFNEAATTPIVWIEILSPDVTEPLVAQAHTWQSADLRKLGAFLAACDLFICGDTGPLHLADAANARCLGLFTATSPEHYGCMGAQSTNVTKLTDINPETILGGLVPSGDDPLTTQ